MKARLPQGMGKGPSNNMNQVLKQAQKMQDDITALQADLEEREFSASVGGGAVEITINGKRNVLKLDIKPEVVDPDDVEMLQDLIMSAFNEAVRILNETSDAEMQKLTGGVSFPDFSDMADSNALPLVLLAEQFAKLPGIGMKSAQKLAYHVMSMTDTEAQAFADAVIHAHKTVHTCKMCQNLTDKELCPICANEGRDHSLICVVETPKDITAFERTKEYNGVYHVLHGLISPLLTELHLTS